MLLEQLNCTKLQIRYKQKPGKNNRRKEPMKLARQYRSFSADLFDPDIVNETRGVGLSKFIQTIPSSMTTKIITRVKNRKTKRRVLFWQRFRPSRRSFIPTAAG